MDRYRKIDWNKDRESIKEINEKYGKTDIPEPISIKNPHYREKGKPRIRNDFTNNNHIFWQVFFAILAAALVLGGFKLYWNYLEEEKLKKELEIVTEQMKSDFKEMNKNAEEIQRKNLEKFRNFVREPLPFSNGKQVRIEKTKKREPVCKPAKIDGVWQNHCE